MMNTQSFFQVTLARAQFFFFGNRPSQLKSTSRAPVCRASSRVPSTLPESTTTMSSQNATDARHAAMLPASFFTGIRTEMGALSGMVGAALPARLQVELRVAD